MHRLMLALLFGPGATTLVNAQPAAEMTAQLVSRTSSLLPRRATVALDMQNLSALPASDWSNLRTLFEAELRETGVEVAGGTTAETRLRITLAESSRGLLFVAESTSGDKRQVAMLPWNPPVSAEGKPRATLTKKFLWAQPEPILDVLLVDSNTQMLVLSPSKVASFRLSGGEWILSATASLVLPRPIPRDPRGRIENTADGFRAYLPGATCTGSWKPDLKVTCAAGNEIWPDPQVRWLTDRNMLESDTVKAPFYSVANGLFGGGSGWGSDIAALEDPCVGAPTVIASGAAADHEEVRAYNSQATPLSETLPLPGPVTALWPAESRGQVTLVIRNRQTGEYEASRLGLACSL